MPAMPFVPVTRFVMAKYESFGDVCFAIFRNSMKWPPPKHSNSTVTVPPMSVFTSGDSASAATQRATHSRECHG
jgi:hypothetical protein